MYGQYSGTSDKGPSKIGTTSPQGTKSLPSKCPLFGGSTVYRQGAKSVLMVGRLSTLRSVHYRRFHCILSDISAYRNKITSSGMG